jgi:hypothetical protein
LVSVRGTCGVAILTKIARRRSDRLALLAHMA